jgi:cystathionine beta-synthase
LLQMKDRFKEGDVVVVIFHDHGTRYLGKMFNDEWMRDRGFLMEEKKTARDLVAAHRDLKLVCVSPGELVSHALDKMKKFNITQIPVLGEDGFVGAVDESSLFRYLIDHPGAMEKRIDEVMMPPFPVVREGDTLETISKLITRENPAVLVQLDSGGHHIITRNDIIKAIAG